MKRFVFIVACGSASGMGHLSRCHVLAEALAANGAECRFYLTDSAGLARARPFPARPVADLEIGGDESVVVDGYGFSDQQLTQWQSSGNRLILIDDLADAPFAAEIVLNHNLYGDRLDYAAYGAGQVLAGPRYTMIKPGFAALRGRPADPDGPILVSFGGSALAALGLGVAANLAVQVGGAVDVVVPAFAVPEGYAAPPGVQLHVDPDMVALMREARAFVGALGVGYLEALAAGRPAVGIRIVANQQLALEAAGGMGLTVLGQIDDDAIVATLLRALAAGDRPLPMFPDGRGAQRVADVLLA